MFHSVLRTCVHTCNSKPYLVLKNNHLVCAKVYYGNLMTLFSKGGKKPRLYLAGSSCVTRERMSYMGLPTFCRKEHLMKLTNSYIFPPQLFAPYGWYFQCNSSQKTNPLELMYMYVMTWKPWNHLRVLSWNHSYWSCNNIPCLVS